MRNDLQSKQPDDDTRRLLDTYRSVHEAGRALSTIQNPETLFQQVCDIAVRSGGIKMAWVGTIDPQTLNVSKAAYSGVGVAYLDDARISLHPDIPQGQGPIGKAIRESRFVIIQDFLNDPITTPWHQHGRRYGWGAIAAFPLYRNQSPFGIFSVYSGEPNYFGDDIVRLMEGLAEDIGQWLTRHDAEQSRILAEDNLRQSEERFKGMFNAIADPIYITDTTNPGQFAYVNDAACEFLGYTREEVLTLGPADIDTPEFGSKIQDRMRDLLKNRHATFESAHVTKQGDIVPVEINLALIGLMGRELIVATARDVRERNKLIGELHRSNADLEQFCFMISHDLRQPLRVITKYTELIEQRLKVIIDDDVREFMSYVKTYSTRMNNMIRDLLNYSKFANQENQFSTASLSDIIRDAVENLSVSIQESGATITVQPNPPTICGHPSELSRLMLNLVGNAVKYRLPDTAPEIEITFHDQTDGFCRVEVRDNGIGIPSDQYGRIFEVFQRLHTQDQYEGSGIGLAVCKRIVERHGGKIWVDSAMGQGSAFHFTLPLSSSALSV